MRRDLGKNNNFFWPKNYPCLFNSPPPPRKSWGHKTESLFQQQESHRLLLACWTNKNSSFLIPNSIWSHHHFHWFPWSDINHVSLEMIASPSNFTFHDFYKGFMGKIYNEIWSEISKKVAMAIYLLTTEKSLTK